MHGARPITAFCAIMAAATAAWGAEATAPDAGLAGARREFKAIRESQANAPGAARLELPEISPPVEATPPVAPAPRPAPTAAELAAEKRKAERARNWLVDAVLAEKGDRASESTKDRADALEAAETAGDPFARLIAEERQRASDADSARAGDPAAANRPGPATASAAPNPLAAYMANWISPQDQALLLPKADDPLSSHAPRIPDATGVELPRAAPDLEEFAPGDPADLAPAHDANPYLAPPPFAPGPATAAPALPPVDPMIATATNPRPSRVESSDPPPAVPPQMTAPAGLANPADDAKYFPQLKRF